MLHADILSNNIVARSQFEKYKITFININFIIKINLILIKMNVYKEKSFNQNFDDILKNFWDNRKESPYLFKILQTFPQDSTQGIVGTMVLLKDNKVSSKALFKISKGVDFIVNHEYLIALGLKPLTNFCPNFIRPVGLIKSSISTDSNEPFKVNSYTTKYVKDILIAEYVEDSLSFYQFMKQKTTTTQHILSIQKQVLLSILMAQNRCSFTHYDLHDQNVLIKKCSDDLIVIYRIDENTAYAVPTYGYYPIIIDFGYSYVDTLVGNPFFSTLTLTDGGYLPYRFDEMADFRLFLHSSIVDIKKIKTGDENESFVKKSKQFLLTCFPNEIYDKEHGWSSAKSDDPLTVVFKSLLKQDHTFLFYSRVIKLCQSLIILPLNDPIENTKPEVKDRNLKKVWEIFTEELNKIRKKKKTTDFIFSNHIKELFDEIRDTRFKYLLDGNYAETMKKLREKIDEIFDKDATINQDFDTELFFSSLLLFSVYLEDAFVRQLKLNEKEFAIMESKILFKDPLLLYEKFDETFPLRSNSINIMIFDNVSGTAYKK